MKGTNTVLGLFINQDKRCIYIVCLRSANLTLYAIAVTTNRAITDKVNEAAEHLASDYISNLERRIAKRRAMVQQRKVLYFTFILNAG